MRGHQVDQIYGEILLEEQVDELAELITTEMGSTAVFSQFVQVPPPISTGVNRSFRLRK